MIPLTTWVSEGSAGPTACKQTCHILPWYVFNNAPHSFLFLAGTEVMIDMTKTYLSFRISLKVL